MHCSILCTINTDMSLICSVDLGKQSLVICKSHIIMFSTKVESLCLIHNPPLYSNKQIREGKLFFQGRHVPKDTHVLKSACFLTLLNSSSCACWNSWKLCSSPTISEKFVQLRYSIRFL